MSMVKEKKEMKNVNRFQFQYPAIGFGMLIILISVEATNETCTQMTILTSPRAEAGILGAAIKTT